MIEPPCGEELTDWVHTDEETRVAYISAVVEALKDNPQRMREMLVNDIRRSTASHKRKANRQVDASRAKKSEPIRRRASDLLNAFSSTAVLKEDNERATEEFIRMNLSELDDEGDSTQELKSCRRLDKTMYAQTSAVEPTKYWTKRPAVDRLNPERLCAVERIVSGEVEREKTRELYRSKQRMANILTRKMDKRDIDEMELKLEQTAMGLLFNKEQFRVLTSKEQKVVCANAAAARQTVSEGFKRDDEKYKDIDEKLAKADSLLKNQNLAGVDIVSRMKIQNGMTTGSRSPKSGKPPPPLPSKKTASDENSSVSQTEDQNNAAVRYSSPRPFSMPVLESTCYDSVNARRQINCQLCSEVVYLAERMQVEGMFIHKKCFRCAFCGQPLRLGNCAQDRNLHDYNPRLATPRFLKFILK
ncbi:unnamed protein product [Gongylonema pulchrum]|uniref:LIM zinc-binding domain-containing protein n=1 Tax=Gongylonema pulchrum TaxID=637853 RepID=A0A3P7MLC1_9BILA|nr:unnamed protein product [Gongylonema pulchrum]